MAASGKSSSTPRSVADATRFTSNTPHANSKSMPSSSNNSNPSPSPQRPQASTTHQNSSAAAASATTSGRMAAGARSAESMEERVRRLRAAHLAARQHDVSRFDRTVNASRKFFDAAHKFTVAALIGFSGLALFVTIYATGDMMIYNRKRRNEFFALQQQLKTDSLEAARLAYMTGKATPEQIELVEEAQAKAHKSGIALPPLLSSPSSMAANTSDADSLAANPTGLEATAGSNLQQQTTYQQQSQAQAGAEEGAKRGGGGILGWLYGGLKKEETREDDPLWNTRSSASAATGSSSSSIKDQAAAVFEQERENQRRGGPLDRIGTENEGTAAAAAAAPQQKKGWLW